MYSQQAESRSTWRRTGRGLSAAAADDFCDPPEKAYLGTGWVEETEDSGRRESSSISNSPQGKTTKQTNSVLNQLWEAV